MKKLTLHSLFALKEKKEPITVLTAYDATFAKLVSESGVEVILVGDSLGMVIQGHDSTVPVTNEEMCYHMRCVAKGNQSAFLIADMPYMAYATEEQALSNAAALMQAGANMVKLEGGEWLLPTIKKITDRGIPVCAHLGLTPQSVDSLGGFKVQGRDEASAKQILSDAIALQDAGATLLVLECVPQELAKEISEALTIPTIGIGAGKDTDGQVLVLQDMLGLNSNFKPKFVRNFMADESAATVEDAIIQYVKAVKEKSFPAAEHCFD
ncbi:3-methyl-2-oxobutanoate hydroxymethyltransferase [Aliikangiella marina]|uniref:3-methyl-2-oxobutanoate hydroxymethyltransferase n=1 Tax=Aliikangiella marina TaxID=1712262 RepID=A0A545TC81_9GAMM|nr:3-methyl-2-oxobutanoate hydroxymethyltransferase [Aliikangiella marina]TQV74801.1 3-methyl-2-oxobutanoate hydroxymethyltransferase [Aliikangiella marina]